jgi:sulfite exporter TauE/SafE
MELLSGFLLGLLGSFHCIGMCGPIAIALPKHNRLIISRIIYNFGRVITYALFGLLFGTVGRQLDMFGMQQIVSVSIGVIIILFVLTPQSYKIGITQKLGLYKAVNILKFYFGRVFKNHSLLAMLIIGVLNGLLPCGFVYIAVAGAIAVGSPVGGMLFMAMFGIGTIPVMFAASIAGNFININIRQKLSRLIPALSIILAVIFILRGFNLGIPYISPKNPVHSTQKEVICQ